VKASRFFGPALALTAFAALYGCSRHDDPGEVGRIAVQALSSSPRVARAIGGQGPGDPVNLAVSGSREALLGAVKAAGWLIADPVDKDSSNRLVRAVLAMEAYPSAPVSPLELLGRPQDLAIEQPSGPTPATRHHARIWDSGLRTQAGSPVWLLAASYDKSVGKSPTTGKFTHEIAPEVDVERDKLVKDLALACKAKPAMVSDFASDSAASNADGFPYATDRNLAAIDCSG
jgi:hypothetical protein